MTLWDRVAELLVEIEGLTLERRELAVSAGWTRVTTTVVLHGGGETGEGEDVTYVAAEHDGFPEPDLVGSYLLWQFSRLLDGAEIGGGDRDHRRWAFESAALDLALRQAGRSLGAALGMRAFLQALRQLAGPAVDDARQLVATIRHEAEALAGTSRELRQRVLRAADAAEARLVEVGAMFDVLREEAEDTALDVVATVRNVR